jgi:YVTN family beta-propeller protein
MQFVFPKLNQSLRLAGFLLLAAMVRHAGAQSTAIGTFGEIRTLGETPSDVVLDELRGMLYLVRSSANRVDVYDYVNKRLLNPISVGTFPVSAAMSPDGGTLYVTNATSTSVSIVNLANNQVVNTLSLPVRPEGVAVGNDGRVLITTQGTGTNNQLQTLLLYDPRQDAALQLTAIAHPASISTANVNQNVFLGRPITPFPGRLRVTPDGNFIVGMVAINQQLNTAQTTMFVYEVASGTVLRTRTVTGQSTVLSMAPDGSRFMAGASQYDFATLNVNGQVSAQNLPFNLPTGNSFPAAVNQGGSVFSPDGATLYSAFNYTATAIGQRPTANILLIGNPRHLGVRLGIRMPESVLGKMVITSDGSQIFAISESGFMTLPVGNLFDYPILQPETTQIFLASDPCNKGIASADLRVSNLGRGRLTFSVPSLTAAPINGSVVAQVASGLAPSTVRFTMDPGRVNINRRPGTNVYNTNNGQAITVNLNSLEAINIPNTIRIFMNSRQPDQRGLIFPIPTLSNQINPPRALRDIVLDEPRNRIYIANSGFNRIEVFDTQRLKFLEPLEVGQFPQHLAISPDRSTLYVGNVGGESLMTVDLETLTVTGNVEFPPNPRSGTANPPTIDAMAMTLSGLQFVTNDGRVWRTLGNQAIIRTGGTLPANGIVGGNRFMTATPGGEYAMLLASNTGGVVGSSGYLFDAALDTYTTTRVVFQNAYASYTAPVSAAVGGNYFLAGGLILGSSLTPIGGVERPGAVQNVVGPNGQVTQVSVSAGNRNTFATLSIDANRFLRVSTPVRTSAVAVTRDEERTTIELVDVRTQSESIAGILPENPAFFVSGSTQQINVPGRMMAVDSRGTVYLLTVSGLTMVPTTATNTASRPTLPQGARSIVNANDGTTTYRVGSFLAINGTGLAAAATADTVPLPTVLGGSCVTFNDIPLPIISATPTQIVAQIPPEVRPGLNIVQVRSLLNAQQSDTVTVTVLR